MIPTAKELRKLRDSAYRFADRLAKVSTPETSSGAAQMIAIGASIGDAYNDAVIGLILDTASAIDSGHVRRETIVEKLINSL